MTFAIDRQPQTAAMIQFTAGLAYDQAPLWPPEVDSASLEFLSDAFKVRRRVEAEKRKPEFTTSGGGPVTRAGIATRLGDDRHHLRVKVRCLRGGTRR